MPTNIGIKHIPRSINFIARQNAFNNHVNIFYYFVDFFCFITRGDLRDEIRGA